MSRRRLGFVIAVVILGRMWSGAADKVDAAYQQSFLSGRPNWWTTSNKTG